MEMRESQGEKMDYKQIEINRLHGVVREFEAEKEILQEKINKLETERHNIIADYACLLGRLVTELRRGDTISDRRQEIIKAKFEKYNAMHEDLIEKNKTGAKND